LLALGNGAIAGISAFKGEMQMQSTGKGGCALDAAASRFDIYIAARDDAAGVRFEGYLLGPKILHGYFAGNDLGHLTLHYPGGDAQNLQLRRTAQGVFEGTLAAHSLWSALDGCPLSAARIQVTRVGDLPAEQYAGFARGFALDAQLVQAYLRARQGPTFDALTQIRGLLARRAQGFPPGHPQLLANDLIEVRLDEALGDFAAAVPAMRHALPICEQTYGADSACTQQVLTELSSALANTGGYDEAETLVRRALQVSDRIYGPDAAASIEDDIVLAVVRGATGHYDDSAKALQHALDLSHRLQGADSPVAAFALFGFGALYRATGQYARAEAALREALRIDEKRLPPTSFVRIQTGVVLAQVLRLRGARQEAEARARAALDSAEKMLGGIAAGNPLLTGAQMALASTLRDGGRYAEAEALYRSALQADRKVQGPDGPLTAMVGIELGRSLRLSGRNADALPVLAEANRTAQMLGAQMLAWRAPSELMQTYARGKPPQTALAIFYGKQAVNTLQRLRGNLADNDPQSQQSFVSAGEINEVYRTLTDLLIGAGRIAEAQQVVAMLKEQEYFEFLQRSGEINALATKATYAGRETEWTQRYGEISANLVSLGQDIAAMEQRGDTQSAAYAAKKADLKVAKQKFDAVVTEIAKTAGKPETAGDRRNTLTATGSTFQSAIKDLGHDVVLAQYIVLDDKIDILLTTADKVPVTREVAVTRADLNARVFRFLDEVGHPPKADPLPDAQALYQLLVQPIREDLRQSGAKTLVLSLDHTLRYLPFAALHDGQHYLIENYALALYTEAGKAYLKDPPRPTWTVLGLGVTEAKNVRRPEPDGHDRQLHFAALANVRSELSGVVGNSGLTGTMQLDGQFTEKALESGLSQNVPVIHIASHYQFTPGSDDDSFLLLGDGNVLSLKEMRIDDLSFTNVDLLTLSACQTAVGGGEDADGIEVEGLGNVAQSLGAKAVLATLWSVDDRSTATLMQSFYRLRGESHLGKAEALRQAQLALLGAGAGADAGSAAPGGRGSAHGGASAADLPAFHVDPHQPYAHPYYWAPFTLIGNWR
jgi:CHAT domain-containing protein